MPSGDRSQRGVCTRERALRQRLPGEVREAFALAVGDDLVLGAACSEVVLVLNRDDRNDLARRLDLFDRHVGKSDVPDLPLSLQFGKRADGVLERHGRIDRVQLIEVDPI